MAIKTTIIEEVIPDHHNGCFGLSSAVIILFIIGIVVIMSDKDDEGKDDKQSQPTTEQVSEFEENEQTYPIATKPNATINSSQNEEQIENFTDNTYTENTIESPDKSGKEEELYTLASNSSEDVYLYLYNYLINNGKNLRLKGAEYSSGSEEVIVISTINKLKGTEYYEQALTELKVYCRKYASEYDKNGEFFLNDEDFYSAYISPNYSQILKENKRAKK